MCFNGADSNSQAFVYGSLLLMFTPVTALGGLAYWIYRRMKAADSHRTPHDDASHVSSERGVVLPMIERIEPR